MPQFPNKIEGQLLFNFPADWQVVVYDQDKDDTAAPGFYRRVLLGSQDEQLPDLEHICGMDFVCRLPGQALRLQFIEVKDDRKRATAEQVRHGELYQTIVRKTFNTLSGLLLAERLQDDVLRPMACLSRQPDIEVVLFLEEPPLAPVEARGNKRQLRRLVRTQKRTDLDQKLTAKLAQWHVPFQLYNLTNRQPPQWQVIAAPE